MPGVPAVDERLDEVEQVVELGRLHEKGKHSRRHSRSRRRGRFRVEQVRVRVADETDAGLEFGRLDVELRGRSDARRRHVTITRDVAASSESEVIAQQLSTLGARITRLEARLAEVDPVIARLEGAALTTARSMQEISKHWDAVYEAMRRGEQHGDDSSRADARRPTPRESSTDDAS